MKAQAKTLKETKGNFIEGLAQRLGITANAKNIFGEPVERDGVTVIPVAKASYAFGGGGGEKENERGSGGGGGVTVNPIGYIELKDGETRFRPTRDWISLLPMLAATAPIILLSVWRIKRLLKKS